MMNFRSISLCNVVYKILSKILVKNIKPILDKVIGETQSTFVSHRLIADNIIIASEVLHWMTKRKKIMEVRRFLQ